MKELNQPHTIKTVDPLNMENMTIENKSSALRYLMFLTKKRIGRIKARGCADYSKQREYMTKEETYAPTVSAEALMISCLIYAKVGRDVATIDIPGAFMHADMKDEVNMKLEVSMADLFAKIDPQLYEESLTMKNGKKVLYVRLKKALYGTVQTTLLFYYNLFGNLKEWGFELNSYDTCVANMKMYGKQCTILWHNDDLNISRVDSNFLDSIIKIFDEESDIYARLTATRGKIHNYLGMVVDYTTQGKVVFTMFD